MDWSPEDVTDMYAHKGETAYQPGTIPLIVLTRGKGGFERRADSRQLEKERLQAQEEPAQLSSNCKHMIYVYSGHNIHIEDPGMVTEAIKKVYTSARKHTVLK